MPNLSPPPVDVLARWEGCPTPFVDWNVELAGVVAQLSVGAGVGLEASRALVTDTDGNMVVSTVTATEVLRLAGVTSGVQGQLDGKVAKQTITALTDNTGGTANDTVAAIPDPADTPATADALRDDLVANTLPALRDALADLAAKVNALITAVG